MSSVVLEMDVPRTVPVIPEPSPEPAPPAPLILSVGAWVAVLFWRPFALPGNASNGSWDVVYGSVVTFDDVTACFLISNPNAPSWFDNDNGGPLRFVRRDRVFATKEEALAASSTLPQPK